MKGSDTYMGLTDPRLVFMDVATKRVYFRCRLWERDGGLCGICGKPVVYHEMDVDHSRARAMGGPDHWANLRPAHVECNRRRRHLDIYPGKTTKNPRPN